MNDIDSIGILNRQKSNILALSADLVKEIRVVNQGNCNLRLDEPQQGSRVGNLGTSYMGKTSYERPKHSWIDIKNVDRIPDDNISIFRKQAQQELLAGGVDDCNRRVIRNPKFNLTPQSNKTEFS